MKFRDYKNQLVKDRIDEIEVRKEQNEVLNNFGIGFVDEGLQKRMTKTQYKGSMSKLQRKLHQTDDTRDKMEILGDMNDLIMNILLWGVK